MEGEVVAAAAVKAAMVEVVVVVEVERIIMMDSCKDTSTLQRNITKSNL